MAEADGEVIYVLETETEEEETAASDYPETTEDTEASEPEPTPAAEQVA